MGNTSSSNRNGNALQYAVWQKRIFEYNITRRVKPFPSIFQIQTINLCNASCKMCPISKMGNIKPEIMSDKLFKKIIEEISREHLKFTSIYPYLQNEPLMDADIFNKLKLIKKFSDEQISTGLVTNGTLLTLEKIKELEKSEVDIIIISLDAFTEETYNKIRQGLNFKKVMKNIENLIDSSYDNYLAVKFVLQKDNISELNVFKNYWKKKGVSVHISYLSNRSGDLNTFNDLCLEKKDLPISIKAKSNFDMITTRGCHYPMITFNILSNGDVILCCENYSKKIILGNVEHSSIKEIWNSKKYQNIRNLIYKKEFEKIPPCIGCEKART